MREVVGLPMSGKLDFAVDLDLPNEANKAGKVGPDWTKAEGDVELGVPVGLHGRRRQDEAEAEDQEPAQRRRSPRDGIEFGKIKIDSLLARIEVKNGKLELTKFDAKSADGELHVDYSMDARSPTSTSRWSRAACGSSGSDELLKREPKTLRRDLDDRRALRPRRAVPHQARATSGATSARSAPCAAARARPWTIRAPTTRRRP